MADPQQVNVTVVNRGCGSGCGTMIAVLLVAGLVVAGLGWVAAHWYVTVAVLVVAAGVWATLASRDPYRHLD